MAWKKTAPNRDKAAGQDEAAEHKSAASPLTTLILADIALSAGSALLQRGMNRGLPGASLVRGKAGTFVKSTSLTGSLVGTALARVATRSVPGAIVVGGGLVAKALYNKRKAARARKAAEKA